MGHRVMETPNLHGKTAARHLVPRSVRRSRKRALRMAAKSPQPVSPAGERKHVARSVEQVASSVENAQPLPGAVRRSWKQVLGIAAKTQETAPAPTPPEHTIPLEAPQTVPTPARRVRKQEVTVAAKVHKPAKPPKRVKPLQPGTPIPQPPPQTEVEVDEAKPMSTDKLEDGVVEWGIKREDQKESES